MNFIPGKLYKIRKSLAWHTLTFLCPNDEYITVKNEENKEPIFLFLEKDKIFSIFLVKTKLVIISILWCQRNFIKIDS